MRATADSRARSPVAAEARASGSRAVRAAVMDGHDLDVHVVPPPGRVLVLDARIREMDVLIEVRQIVLASPFFDFVLVAVGMAVVVVAVPITLMQPLLIVAFELVVQHDAIDSRAALLQALRFAFERAIDLNIVFELPLAFNARVERLAVLLIAISMALKQASAISCQGHGVISRPAIRVTSTRPCSRRRRRSLDRGSRGRSRSSRRSRLETTRNAPTVASVRDSEPRNVYSRSRSCTIWRSCRRGRFRSRVHADRGRGPASARR